MLSVRNGARPVEFYKSAFGAIEVYRVEVVAVEENYGWRLAAWSIHSAITGRSAIRFHEFLRATAPSATA